MKEHKSLLDKHFSKLNDKCYRDESLHLLAFDLIYCCKTYGYYRGLVAPVTGKTIRKTMKTDEIAEKKAETWARIQSLERELTNLDRTISEFEDISLIGVQVTSDKYGGGTVISQDVNRVTVCFPGVEKTFILDQKYTTRPKFEDDEVIVAAFTEFGRTKDRMQKVQKELKYLMGQLSLKAQNVE